MKRLYCLLSLFLCVCLLLPVFSISVYAQEVDGNQVYTYWYIDNPEEQLTNFENTIITLAQPTTFTITSTIILLDEIPKNNVFDLNIGLNYSDCTISQVEVKVVSSSSKVLDTLYSNVTNNMLSISSLQYEDNVSKFYINFTISNPSWRVINTIFNVTIDGDTYKYEKNMTWSAWCNSNYNTLGLYVDNGKIYKGTSLDGYMLKLDGESVLSSDLVQSNKSYVLEELAPVVTYGYFVIDGTQYQYETGMTWSDYVSSTYNTLGLYLSGDYVCYNTDSWGVVSVKSTPVKPSDLVTNSTYVIGKLNRPKTFYINGYPYTFNDGDNWIAWVGSINDTLGLQLKGGPPTYYVYFGDGTRVYQATGNNGVSAFNANALIVENGQYGTRDYCEGVDSIGFFSAIQYEFDFSITSVSTSVTDDHGLLNGIISWLKKVWSSITYLPSQLISGIGDLLKLLFIPNSDRLEAMIINTLGDYGDKFGVLSDSVEIIDNITSAFTYNDTQSTVHMPEITVNLAGADFTFGGYEVDVVPDGLESIVDILKGLINIVATVSFVFAMKKRFTEVLNR